METKNIEKLEKLLAKAQKSYYYGNPIMSDKKYDSLLDKLKQCKPNSKVIKRVGAVVPNTSPLDKIQHRIAMGSQSKVNIEAEFVEWAKKIDADKDLFVVQEKVDGLSVELVYKNGKLQHAITRGDGVVGESITHNVRLMKNVEERLPKFSGSLRGEIFIKKAVYDKYFKNKNYANPRNAAAGIARRKVPNGADKLKVYYFDVISESKTFATEVEKVEFIKKKLGLLTVNSCIGNLDFVLSAYKEYVEKHRQNLAYSIDALVIKLNSIKKQQALGEVDDRPRGQVAWKFESENADTRLASVRWDIGLTGRLTPVAVLDPVSIGGTTVQHASLHNFSHIRKLKIAVNDVVTVSKRGDIIPQVEFRVEKGSPREEIEPPEYCPVCTEPTMFEGEYLTCSNPCCAAKSKGDWQKWIKTLELDFLGDAFVDKMFKNYELVGVWQLYQISAAQIAALPGYAEKSAERVYEQIHSKNEIDLVTFLTALNIPNISSQTFQSVIHAGYYTIEKLQALTEIVAVKMHNIGEVTARQLVTGLKSKETAIKKLLKYVKLKEQIEGMLMGKSFCFTGEIFVRRPLAQRLVRDNGGVVKSSVVKDLDYLVQANPNSKTAKTAKAKECGVKIISGEEFMRLMNISIATLQRCAVEP
jgi:DNA ligase (NAD+)